MKCSVIRFCSLRILERLPPLFLKSMEKTQVIEGSNNLYGPSVTFLDHPRIKREYEVVYDGEKPDIVFLDLHASIQSADQYDRLALIARRKFGWSPMLIAPCYEASYEDIKLSALRHLDKTFSSGSPNAKNITLGFGTFRLLFLDREQYLNVPKPRFCNFLYANDSFPQTRVRRTFCKLLMRYKHVDCPSRSLNNTRLPSALYETRRPVKDKNAFLKDYKFTIAFENRSVSSYVSEKIIDPLAVGSIPIYWGSPKIANYLNPDAFINCHDYQNFEQVVERVIAVDNDPNLYARMLNAPPTVPGNYYHDLIPKMHLEWKSLIAEALERRQERRGSLYASTRLGWMVLSNLHHDIAQFRRMLTPNFTHMIKKIFRQD